MEIFIDSITLVWIRIHALLGIIFKWDFMNYKLWLIFCFLILLDFITTVIGVWQGDYHEMNPLVNALYKADAFYPFFVYSLILVPMMAFGIINLFKTEMTKNFMLFIFIIQWIFAVSGNILILLFF